MMKFLDGLFSTKAAGFYMLLFAFVIGAATFIENDFGTSAAQQVIFKSRWFEVLLLLFATTIVVNIFRFRMIQQKKWAILIFHASVIVILLGSAVTRYAGYEGMMHIREGKASNEFLSSDTYLQFEVEHAGEKYRFDEHVLFSSLGKNHFKKSYQLGDEHVNIEVKNFIPNPEKMIGDDPEGVPVLKLVMSGRQGREEYYIKDKDLINLNGTLFNFGNPELPQAVNLYYQDNQLSIVPPATLTQMQMATQKLDTLDARISHPLLVRTLYSSNTFNFVIGDFKPKGNVIINSTSRKMKNESFGGVVLNIETSQGQEELFLYGKKGISGAPQNTTVGDLKIIAAYGAKRVKLPFSLKLHDFVMERYPGTNSASSYASEVTLVDPRYNLEKDKRIFMNNILNYKGFRFFQSSFDKDELGTYLSVNHDAWGTWISYIGYGLLTLGMILTFFSKRSRFRSLSDNIKALRHSTAAAASSMVILFLFSFTAANANPIPVDSVKLISQAHAEKYGQLIVQDHRGRLKPMNTLSKEILRKLARKETLYGLSADQIMLGMTVNPDTWSRIPLIKTSKDPGVKELIKVEGRLAAYNDFFDESGRYLLQEEVRTAHGKEPIDRGMFEKELIKLDERINICNIVFARQLMRLYPVLNDPNNLWVSPGEVARSHKHGSESFVEKFYPAYTLTVMEAVQSQNWTVPDKLISELTQFQKANGGSVVPSDRRVKTELWLNKTNIFGNLGKYYSLAGLAILILFFTSVFKDKWSTKWPLYLSVGAMGLFFLAHTVGLGVRWYVSGHAPWSNGYESMIYIGWTTVLAGLIFARKTLGGLAATALLASIILMVATLSYLDPEITPLVPVLRSYWLTIHVSLEAGSYGFLMLGAIIGVLNLILMIFSSAGNFKKIQNKIQEMTYISEMTLICGLFMVSIGTYLGGVWANESWGRYWGWDAKETWALVTILVYAFILHMRFIPGLRGLYAFNVASLFGFASVAMTYFGVNYYLSGLHSYAAGDPIPIPSWVYYTVASLVVVSLAAFWRNKVLAKNK